MNFRLKWVKRSLYGCLFLALIAFFESWNEQQLFTAWIENFVALVFRYGGIVLGIFCGMVVGKSIAEKTSRIYDNMTSDKLFFRKKTYFGAEVLGWIIGIIVAVVIIVITLVIGKEIPGIGWRLWKD